MFKFSFKLVFNQKSSNIFKRNNLIKLISNAAMSKPSLTFEGKLSVKAKELNLDLTLLGGQSFRWQKVENAVDKWRGVAFGTYWELQQTENTVDFTAHQSPALCAKSKDNNFNGAYFENILRDYFRLDFDLSKHVELWKQSHKHFENLANNLKAVRVLDQEPLENLLSFICSQNNNIKRISSMINWLCSSYGEKIGSFNGQDVYAFPTLDALTKEKELDAKLRAAKFGYRAKFIAQSVHQIQTNGGNEWFAKLRAATFDEARQGLVTLPGIGFKVADCICLMSLNHLEAVPIDTHIFKVAQRSYMLELAETKSVTPKIYDDIAKHFRKVYGEYAGWAQTVLFCSELQQFQPKAEVKSVPAKKKKRK